MSRPIREWALILTATLSAVAYFLLGRLGAGGWVALKALAVVSLALLAWQARSRAGPLLAAALAVHSVGDVLLEVGPLLPALATFGAGHVVYAILFWRERRRWEEVDAAAKLRLGLLALAGAAVLSRVAPDLPGQLDLAVPIYSLLLLTMAACAQVAGRGAPWVPAGALLYVLSDSLLALDLFTGPLAWVGWMAWPAYWAGQAAITLGWLRPTALAEPRAVV